MSNQKRLTIYVLTKLVIEYPDIPDYDDDQIVELEVVQEMDYQFAYENKETGVKIVDTEIVDTESMDTFPWRVL